MILVRRPPDVLTFLAQAGPFLAEREAQHNLLFGICSLLARDPAPFGEDPAYLAIAETEGRVLGVAVRTPPHNLVLSEMDDLAVIEPLVRDVRDAVGTLPGVLGPGKTASAFVRAWREHEGGGATLTMSNRIYRASMATPPSGVAGEMRPYRDDDHDLTIRWFDAFLMEALPDEAMREPTEALLRRRLDDPDGGLRLWEDEGRPVSLAGFGSRTPNGIRVGPVYTPPESRRKGYAGALVGWMTAALLEGTHRYCFLFTDLANPTANGIYQRIGYEAVSDVEHYTFV